MRIVSLVVSCWLCLVPAAANPIIVSATADEVKAEVLDLDDHLDEPVGLLASKAVPKLGLAKGDLVRALNGRPIVKSEFRFSVDTGLIYLDVLRGTKPIVVRIAVKLPAKTDTFDRAELKARIVGLRDHTGVNLQQVTRKQAPAGVQVRLPAIGLDEGDIIRQVDGKPVDTIANLLATLEAAADHPEIVLAIERAEQPFTYTMKLENDPSQDAAFVALLDQVKQVSTTRYEVPKKLRDAILATPEIMAKGARVVPAMKDGKPVGFKLYAIRPSSIYARLGLQNGDTLKKLAGVELLTVESALEAFKNLPGAKSLKVEIERGKKPVTLEWFIK